MDRGKTSHETGHTSHEQRATADKGAYASRQRTRASSVWQAGQSASPAKCTNNSDHGRRLAFDRLHQEVLGNVSEAVKEQGAICHSVRRLWALCGSCPRPVDSLGDLFEFLRASGGYPAFDRLAAIIDHRLAPIIQRHFPTEERAVLEEALRVLVILRILGVPYRPGSPIPSVTAEELLDVLHRLCAGEGLMVWREVDDEPVYVVETAPEQFAEWLLARQVAFLGHREREKALSDALWAALATDDLVAVTEASIRIEAGPFARREAVMVQHPTLGERVIVFESPWKEDQGRRARRVLKRLPEGVPSDHVWIWLPASPDPEEAQWMMCYMALGRALREADEEDRGAALSVMRESYPSASALALRAIAGCYRRGRVVTERGVWRPNGYQGSLVSLTRHLIAWASGGETSIQHTVKTISE